MIQQQEPGVLLSFEGDPELSMEVMGTSKEQKSFIFQRIEELERSLWEAQAEKIAMRDRDISLQRAISEMEQKVEFEWEEMCAELEVLWETCKEQTEESERL